MSKVSPSIDGIGDLKIRTAFQDISDFINLDNLRKARFKFIEIPVKSAGTLKYAHNLGFLPTDVITLSISKSDSSSVVWKYDSFTVSTLTLTASAPCTVRAFIGSYRE